MGVIVEQRKDRGGDREGGSRRYRRDIDVFVFLECLFIWEGNNMNMFE